MAWYFYASIATLLTIIVFLLLISLTSSLANCYVAKRNLNKANGLYTRRLAISLQIGDQLGEGNTLNNLEHDYQMQGNNDEALKLFRKRLIIARKLKDRRGESSGLLNLGEVYASINQKVRAAKYLRSALKILIELGDPRVNQVRSILQQELGDSL
jgi:tetratricopeptide (TPR) repeat protein